MKRILICGLGSVGQRHTRQIKKLVDKEPFEIGALRIRNQKILITDELKGIRNKSPEVEYKLKTFLSIEEAMNWKPEAVFVTNPISMHIDTAIIAAKAGANIFIEKPLDCSIERLHILERLVNDKKLTCMIGYQLRYHPGYLKVKELIQNGDLGNITFADFHFGEWLPGMHPYEDYRTSHSSIREQGGGVIFCLSHKVDLAYWMFGLPNSIYALGGKLSELDLNVEDSVDMLLNYRNDKYKFPLHIHLDFIQRVKNCFVHIVGDRGSVFFDYCKNEININLLNKKDKTIQYSNFIRNDMFYSEIKDFFDCIKNKKASPIPLDQASEVLKICLAAHKSLVSNNVEIIN